MKFDIALPLLRSFVLLVEEGNFTKVAERLRRTQPAISLQLKRLEELTGCRLFEPDTRPLQLTRHGEILLGYAREILRLHDEVRLRLDAEELSGEVLLGCPDFYAASILPQILAPFRMSYPNVRVNVRCALSMALAQELGEDQLDLAIVTQMPALPARKCALTRLRTEQLVWFGCDRGRIWNQSPIPLAMLPEGNLYRSYALESLNQAAMEWRIACTSESVAGLVAMVLADAAVTVLSRTVQQNGLRILGPEDGMPPLPKVALLLLSHARHRSPAASQLASHIKQQLSR
jgi:DNA-binding transcriptional LysR family regulator